MNKTDLARFHRKLTEMQASAAQEETLGKEATRTVTLDQQSVGRLSRMDAMQQQAMAQANSSRRKQLQQRILAALARMQEGEYGYCTECGEEIALKRLEFDPAIGLCITCARG